MAFSKEQGAGRIGCLFILLLLLLVIYISFKAGPVYLDKVNFEDDLNSITSKAGVYGWTDRHLTREILTAAEAYAFEIKGDDIKINRINRFQQAPRIMVTVKFTKDLELPGYVHNFKFEATSSGLIGSL